MSDPNTDQAPDQTADDAQPHGNGDSGDQPTVEELLKQVEDLKAASRKWEGRAKHNKEAADRLAAMERDKMTDDERHAADLNDAVKRAEDAEARAAQAESALLRYKIASEFNLSTEDVEALASVTDEDALRALAARLSGKSRTRPNKAQGRGDKGSGGSVRDQFVSALEDLL